MDHFGYSDEFHSNPLATAILHIHSNYFAGVSITGDKNYGCYSLRIGLKDKIINTEMIYFYGQNRANKETIQQNVKGMTNYLFISWKKQNMIRILLDSKVPWPRIFNLSQFYFGNMYVHEYKYENNEWKFTLRKSKKDNNSKDPAYCRCCHLL